MCNTNSTSFETMRQSCKAAGLLIARRIGPNLYEVPSATDAGAVYTVALAGARALCSCTAGEHCWHGARAQELEAARKATVQVRYAAAMDDVFGIKVA